MSEANEKTAEEPNVEENMKIYKAAESVPQNAQKEIGAGRLKGMTDINPMWRIRKLTEIFGPAGLGWKYTVDRQWVEDGSDGTKCAFCNISLYIREEGEWSDAIPGTGGSSFIAKERSGLYTSDEAFKMALTDALSVACKALGFGADIYWAGNRESKYGKLSASEYVCCGCGKPFEELTTKTNQYYSAQQVYHMAESKNGLPLCRECAEKARIAAIKQIEKEKAKEAEKNEQHSN